MLSDFKASSLRDKTEKVPWEAINLCDSDEISQLPGTQDGWKYHKYLPL